MKIKNNTFIYLATFNFRGKKFKMFINGAKKYAFLNINDKGNYSYPELVDLIQISYLFAARKDFMEIINDTKIKKFTFIPKAIYKNVPILLTSSLIASTLVGCNQESLDSFTNKGKYNYTETYQINDKDYIYDKSSTSVDTMANVSNSNNINNNEENSTNELVNLSTGVSQEDTINALKEKYQLYFADATDDLDYEWDSDFEEYKMAHLKIALDSKAYEYVFGFEKPTLQDIITAINSNRKLQKKYKNAFIEYATNWLTLYPDSDLSVFYYNIKDLEVVECDKEDMMWATLSTTALACYRSVENKIYVSKDINLEDKSSDDYIIFMHETTHAARTARNFENKNQFTVGFYKDSEFGLYTDEALNTYFIYQMQNLNKKSTHYTLISNYIRIIMDCIGDEYTGNDYMNHSVNYFCKQMDKYMGDQNSYYIIALWEAEMSLHYTEYIDVDFENFQDLFDYLVKFYMKKHLKSDMTYDEALQIFDNFYSEVTFNFENLTDPYPEITEEKFLPAFIDCLEEYGISKYHSHAK